MKRRRASEIHQLLGEINHALACYYAGKKADEIIAVLDMKIGELRDALWHEVPRDIALRMDEEDGLPADRGNW